MALPEDFPQLRLVTANRLGPQRIEVRWALAPTSWDFADLSFIVFRSMSPAGPWDELAEVTPGRFVFYDAEIAGASVFRTPYYIVRIASKSRRGCRDSKPFRVEHDPDHIAIEMVRKKEVFLRHRGGIAASILLRKRQGPLCSRCYSHEQSAPTDKNCPECYGTGFTGGYMPAVDALCLFNPPVKTKVLGSMKYEPSQTLIELANWPTVRQDDVLVDRVQNVRWDIMSVQPTTHRMHLISQLCTVQRIDEASVVYDIPVNESMHASVGRSYDHLNRYENRTHVASRSSFPV